MIFEPTVEGLVFLFTERSQLSGEALEEAKANAENLGVFDRVALQNGQRINGPSDFTRRLTNSIIIAFGATIASVTLGLFAAYAFSRFDVPGEGDLLFFILSGRMLPAVVVAMVDGYSRFQAFYKIVLPQTATGIAATTVFSLIFVWNEYAFALMLTSENARTAPPAIATMLGRGGIEWSAIAAGTLAFLIPVLIVIFALRKHLLRGVTFGAIRQ